MSEFVFFREDYLGLIETITELEKEYEECGKRSTEGSSVGDWHDNFAHEEAMRQLGIISKRLIELNAFVSRARVIDESEVAPRKDTVGLGSKITISNEDGEEKRYYIGSYAIFRKSKTVDGKWFVVSYGSPLVSQLMGKRVGEEVLVNVNGSETSVVIEEVLPYMPNGGVKSE